MHRREDPSSSLQWLKLSLYLKRPLIRGD
jgi:hypothetical protein